MASISYNKFKYNALNSYLNGADIRVLIVSEVYVPNADHNFVSDVVANELSGTGYARKVLTNPTITEDDAGDRAYFSADEVVYTAINAGRMSFAIVYQQVTTDADSPVLFCIDMADVITNGGDVTIEWNANGIIELT